MMPRHSQTSPTNRLMLPIILTLVAAVGWGLLFVWRHSAAKFEEDLRGQVSFLHQRQMELLDERAQTNASVGALDKLRSEISALHQELKGLTQTRDQVQADLVGLRAEQDATRLRSSRSQAAGGGTVSPASTRQASDQADIIAAQRALTKLGYGPLVLDGIVGPSTRQAIEDFQDDHGMQVTSELDLATLRQLTASNKTATLE